MSKITISMEGDFYEDLDTAKVFINARDIYYSNVEARNMIRNRIKHSENVSEDEERFLMTLADELTQDTLL